MDSAAVFSTNGKNCGNTVNACSPKYPVRGICPKGWHLPDTTEWKNLYEAVENSSLAMQAIGYDVWPDATDAYGFSALPAGSLNAFGDFYKGSSASFWSSTQNGSYYVYSWKVNTDSAYLSGGSSRIGIYTSVRCLQD